MSLNFYYWVIMHSKYRMTSSRSAFLRTNRKVGANTSTFLFLTAGIRCYSRHIAEVFWLHIQYSQGKGRKCKGNCWEKLYWWFYITWKIHCSFLTSAKGDFFAWQLLILFINKDKNCICKEVLFRLASLCEERAPISHILRVFFFLIQRDSAGSEIWIFCI